MSAQENTLQAWRDRAAGLARRPAVVAGALTVAALAASPLLWTASANASGDQPAAEAATRPALTVSLATVAQAALPGTLSAHGAVFAWQEAQVGAEVGGLRVAELHANVGDRVRKGQRLALFAQEAVQAEVRMAQAAVMEAQAAALDAKANGDRARALKGTGALSEQQVQQMLTQEQAAQARLASAQAQLAMQQLRLKQTEVVAPDDGVISARMAAVGAVAQPGQEMFRLIRQGRLEWRAELAGADLERVQAGQPVTVSSPGGAVWQGKVRMVSPTVDPASRKGLVYVDLQGPAEKEAQPSLRPGLYVKGEMSQGVSQALVVPQAAVVARDGFHYVFLIGKGEKVVQRKVQIGRIAGGQQALLAGVKAGDVVVASGGAFLADGDTVKVVAKPAAPAAPGKTASR